MKNSFYILLLLSFALLAGCSTISKSECLAVDWQKIGLEDATNGIGSPSESNRLTGCSDYNVDVDMAAYNEGQAKGVPIFCQADTAFELGKTGKEYTVVCPTEFNNEYKIGYQYYMAYNNISLIEQALTTNANNISKLESRISRATVQLSSDDDLSVSEETSLRQNIDSMTGQITTHELSIERLEVGLNTARSQLQTLKDHYGR